MAEDGVTEIGRRVRSCRRYRGVSLQVLADRSGLSVSFLSMVENGHRQLERRRDIFAIAEALQVSVQDLTGAPLAPTGPASGAAHATVPALRLAYLATSLVGSDVLPTRPGFELEAEAAEVRERRQACSTEVGAVLPGLLRELHAAAAHGPGQREALRGIVYASISAAHWLKDLGYPDLAWIAAERGVQAAQRLEDAVWIGAAQYVRVQALLGVGALERAAALAGAAADAVPAATREALEVRGMLLLAHAFAATAAGARTAVAALNEAGQIAERTGQGNAFWFMFGPVNTALWRMAVAMEAGDPGTVIQVAGTVTADAVPGRLRRAVYFTDYGRALAAERRLPEAVGRLRQAERLNPDYVRNNPLAREAVQGMLLRERRAAGDRNLRGLAARMGVVPR